MAPVEAIIAEFLHQFQPCFTRPSFTLFETIIRAWLVRLSADGSLVQVWRCQLMERHWTNLHRFVSRYRWSSLALAQTLLVFIVRRMAPGALYVAADATDVERQGKKIPGVFRVYSSKLHRTARIQRLMTLGLLVPDENAGKSGFRCLGLMARLWTREVKQTDMVRQMLLSLDWPAAMRRYLIADSALSSVLVEGWDIVTRIRLDAQLFTPPPPRTGRRGRPRKKGQKRSAHSVFRRAEKTVLRYRGEDVEAVTRHWLVGSWGLRPALVVICRLKRRPDWRPIVLATTDVDMTPQWLLDLYGARLEIEAMFQDIKTNAGFGRCRQRTADAQERFNQLALIAQALKQIILRERQGKDCPKQLNEPWRRETAMTPNQMRRCLLANVITDCIFNHFGQNTGEMAKNTAVKEQVLSRLINFY